MGRKRPGLLYIDVIAHPLKWTPFLPYEYYGQLLPIHYWPYKVRTKSQNPLRLIRLDLQRALTPKELEHYLDDAEQHGLYPRVEVQGSLRFTITRPPLTHPRVVAFLEWADTYEGDDPDYRSMTREAKDAVRASAKAVQSTIASPTDYFDVLRATEVLLKAVQKRIYAGCFERKMRPPEQAAWKFFLDQGANLDASPLYERIKKYLDERATEGKPLKRKYYGLEEVKLNTLQRWMYELWDPFMMFQRSRQKPSELYSPEFFEGYGWPAPGELHQASEYELQGAD